MAQGSAGLWPWPWLFPLLLALALVSLGKQINSSAPSLPPESQGCRTHFHLFSLIKADPITNDVFKMNSCNKNRPWKYSVCKQILNFAVLERMTKVECVSNSTEVGHAATQVKIPAVSETRQELFFLRSSKVGKKINIPIHSVWTLFGQKKPQKLL